MAAVLVTLLFLAVLTAGPRAQILLKNTAILSGSATVIAVLVGTLLAVLVSRTNVVGIGWVRAVMAGWLFLPLYLQAGAWRAGLGTLGWIPGTASWFEGLPGAIWVHAAAAVPVVVWIVTTGLQQVPAELEELASLEATPWQVLRHVTLPLILPHIVWSALLVAVWTAGEMTVTALFMVSTYADELYTAMSATGDVEVAMIQVLPGMFLTVVLVIFAAIVAHGLSAANVVVHWRSRPRLFVTERNWPATGGVFLLLGLFVMWPLINLFVQADPQWRQGWSAARVWHSIINSPVRFQAELIWTVLISGTAATVAVILAILLLWRTRQQSANSWGTSVMALLWACPASLVALGLLAVCDRVDWNWVRTLRDQTIVLPVVGQTLRALPVALLIIGAALHAVPRSLWELTYLDGMSLRRQVFAVFIPLQWRALLTAWLAVLAVVVADLGGTLLLSPPGKTTISARIFDRLHSGADDQVAGISLCLVGTVALLTAIAQWFFTIYGPRATTVTHAAGGDCQNARTAGG